MSQRNARTGRLNSDQRLAKRRGLPIPKEVNTRKCATCGAEKGDTCFVLTATSFQELRETHRTKERKRAATLAAQKRAIEAEQDRPMFLDRTL